MSNHIISLNALRSHDAPFESRRSLVDRIFLGTVVWSIPLIVVAIFLSGSLPGKSFSSAEDTFVYIINAQQYHKK